MQRSIFCYGLIYSGKEIKMSFDSKNFSVMAYANGFTLWNYTTADTLESITASGYFNEIAPFARIGDMILTVAGAQSSVSPAIMAVTAIADGVVTASDFTTAAKA